MSDPQRPQPAQRPRRRYRTSWSSHPKLPTLGDELAGIYRIVGRLGRGGFGTVYHAIHQRTRGEYAIKILEPRLLEHDAHVERFRREAMLASCLSHPNTIRLHDYGRSTSGLVYMVMELLNGRPLSTLLAQRGALSPERATHTTIQILQSLSEAHDYGLIHRDLKPSNIFLCDDDRLVKVLDFGVAMDTSNASPRLTEQGEILGTLAYMSPEQTADEPLCAMTDIYAVGLILYEMLTGVGPYHTMSELDIVMHKLEGKPLPPQHFEDAHVRDRFLPIIAQATASDRRARYQSTSAFLEALLHLEVVSGSIQLAWQVPATDDLPPAAHIAALVEDAERASSAGNTLEAQVLYRRASARLALLSEEDSAPELEALASTVYLRLADLCIEMGEYGAAEYALLRITENTGNDQLEAAAAHLKLAEVLAQKQFWDDAAVHYLATLDLCPRESPSAVHGLLGLALVAERKGDDADAIHFSSSAVKIADQIAEPDLVVRARHQLARAYAQNDDIERAIHEAQQTIHSANPEQIVGLLISLADFGDAAGDQAFSRTVLIQALDYTNQYTNDPPQAAALMLRLSRTAEALQLSEEAEQYAWQSIALFAQHELRWDETEARHTLIRILARYQGLERAIGVATATYELQGTLGDNIGQSHTLNLMGELAIETSANELAERYLNHALLQQEHAASSGKARTHTLLLLARNAERTGRLEEALNLLENATEAAVEIDAPSLQIETRLEYGRLNLLCNYLVDARFPLQEAVLDASDAELPRLEGRALLMLVWMHTIRNDPASLDPVVEQLTVLLVEHTWLREELVYWFDQQPELYPPAVDALSPEIQRSVPQMRGWLHQLAS